LGGAGGKQSAANAAFAQFKVMVTQAEGSQVVQSLTQLGITQISLPEDATQISLSDGSMINGRYTLARDGVTRTEIGSRDVRPNNLAMQVSE
jgi:hypothetical protein